MSTPKKHHYLPEFYLKGFSTAGWLWVYDRERNTYSKRRPETVAIRKGFYSIEDQHGKKDHKEVERRLGVIENQAAPAIRKLDAGAELELRERFAVALFIALLKFRTTAFERQTAELNSLLADPEAAKELLAPSIEGVRVLMKQAGYDGPELQEQAQAFYEYIHEEEVPHQPSPNHRVELMLAGAYKLGTELVLKPWTVARATEGSSFITGDHPYMVVAAGETQDPLSLEEPRIIPPGYETWVPLSRCTCLIIGDEALGNGHIQLHKAEVRAVNVMVALQCERFFMAGDEALLKRVAKISPDDVPDEWSLPSSLRLPSSVGLIRQRRRLRQ